MRHAIVGALALAVLSACSADTAAPVATETSDRPTIEDTPTSTPTPTVTTATPASPTPSPTPTDTDVELPPVTLELDGCTSASQDLVDLVEQQLAGDAVALRLAFVAELDDGTTVFGASIYRADGERISSSDTWLVDGDDVWALSGSANEYTGWPDARDLTGSPSAGDPVPRALQDDCLTPAIRQA